LLRNADGNDGLYDFNEIMKLALPAGYENAYGPDVRNTGIDGFLKYVIDRDNMLGLSAGGEKNC